MATNKITFSNIKSVAFIALIACMISDGANGAAVVARTQPRNNASRMPTVTATKSVTTEPKPVENPVAEIPVETPEPEPIIENKSSTFDDILGNSSTQNTDNADNALAESIRAQRAALDASDAASIVKTSTDTARATGKNACDGALRTCMQSKCGNDFLKCAGDTDTTWGSKMDTCRRDTTCTGEEYRMFSIEIKADRDMNAQISGYNKIIECGNQYNDCIISECGTTFGKCLGKQTGDAAISKCAKIANNCREQDNGLASRMMDAFGTIRGNAEKAIQRDEERLYTIRNAMASTCKKLGAMFDERTLDCVYSVNFFAGENNTLYASKKAYAGSTFDCNQNWFGVDVTTFMENAQRLTREQTAASSAMMGSGVGMAVGAISSGAIDRAIDRHKADKAVKDAEKEHDETYGDKSTSNNNSKSPQGGVTNTKNSQEITEKNNNVTPKTNETDTQTKEQTNKDLEKPKKIETKVSTVSTDKYVQPNATKLAPITIKSTTQKNISQNHQTRSGNKGMQ